MEIPFWKMHGAGNDFILADDRAGDFPASDTAWLRHIADRRRGVGCEGIILVQPSKQGDFRMRFFNPDGREADMCGNGARCLARLAFEIGAAPADMRIETAAGLLRASVRGESVLLEMSRPSGWQTGREIEVRGQKLRYGFVNSGVPHAVVETPDLDGCDVAGLGAAIRWHAAFAPAGTNANFIRVTGPSALRIRTYERGVEAETLACGTGIVASALIAARAGRVRPPVSVTAAGGDVLTVDFRLTDDSAENVTLLGPAAHAFRGTLVYPAGARP
jgi:diaminopimelate epimerase